MYSVELIYTQHYDNPAGEVAKIRNIVDKVFNAHDSNCAYDQIKAAHPDALVCMGALGGWPGFEYEPDSNISYYNYFVNNVEAVDGFAVHAYSGRSLYGYESPLEDPRYSDMTGLKSFSEYCKRIYARWGPWSKPIFITETNTYWFSTGFSCYSYEADWMKRAFQTIDEWNQSNDIKVDALCWFVYHNYGFTSGDQWGDALDRTDNCIYVEEPNRTAGARVSITSPSSDIPVGIESTISAVGVTGGDVPEGWTTNRRFIRIRDWADLVLLSPH